MRNTEPFFRLFLFGLLLFVFACGQDNEVLTPDNMPNPSENEITVTLNPSRFAPLTASLQFTTRVAVGIRLRVIGKNGPDSDVVKFYPDLATAFNLPVLGLYPDFNNQVEVSFLDRNGNIVGTQTINIQTDFQSLDLPEIAINRANISQMRPGFTLVNYFGFRERNFPQKAFMFDAFGDIRWYLDYTNNNQLANLFFDAGMIQLANGNLCFGDVNSGFIYEIDMLGNIQNTWNLRGNRFHHVVFEKPNGNLLATVTNTSLPTVEDLILELDRNSGAIINQWDLRQPLDQTRRTWDTNLANLNIDWVHANGLDYDESDNTIIVSGRTQGTFKLTESNELVWILAPHRGWEQAGNGQNLNQFLLQPLDAQGQPIDDPEVLSGDANHPDFEWSWYQHSPVVLPNGNIMVFDNGDNRNFESTGFTRIGSYSRAVEYKIDATNKTIQQVWTYGKERTNETFSRIVSKVLYFEGEDNVVFAPGAVLQDDQNVGRVIEVDKSSGRIVFEATIIPPRAPFNITFHSVYRVEL